jgi:hypothetical protein
MWPLSYQKKLGDQFFTELPVTVLLVFDIFPSFFRFYFFKNPENGKTVPGPPLPVPTDVSHISHKHDRYVKVIGNSLWM